MLGIFLCLIEQHNYGIHHISRPCTITFNDVLHILSTGKKRENNIIIVVVKFHAANWLREFFKSNVYLVSMSAMYFLDFDENETHLNDYFDSVHVSV